MVSSRSMTRPAYGAWWWLAAFGVWTILALMSASQGALFLAYRREEIRWGPLLEIRLLDWYTCALFLPALAWLARRHPLGGTRKWRTIAVQALAPAVFVVKYALFLPIERR